MLTRDPDDVRVVSRRRALLEAAYGGWLSGLLFAAVDLSLIRIHPSGKRLAYLIAAALAFYPLVALLVGLFVGLVATWRETWSRRLSAESVFLLLAGISLGQLGVAYLLFRVRDPAGFSWPALATGGILCAVAGASFFTLWRYPWTLRPAVRGALAAIWIVSLGTAFAFSGLHVPRVAKKGKPERLVILITADTLRADGIGAYGNPAVKTPHLDALAADGALFLRAQAAASWTLPSHASLLTGLTVPQHGANGTSFAMNESASTIAERFRARGFRTEAITSAYLTSSKFFERGFDSFDGILASPWRWFSVAGLARKVSRFVPALDVPIERRAGSIVDDAVSRLRGSGPLFLWLHFFDPHTDYDPPPGFRDSLPATIPAPFDGHFMPLVKVSKGQMAPPSAAELAVLRKLYDGEVSYLDVQVGRLRREIEKAGLADRTSILFTADHGEAFEEHGVFLHTTAFQEVVHVPLIVWAPGRIRPGSRVEAVVRGIDVAPTLAELGGFRWSGPGEARSVLSLLGEGERLPRPARSDSDIQVLYGEPGALTSSLLVWPWKVIYRPADRHISLFNLEQDPGETRDVASAEGDLAGQLVGMLSKGDTPNKPGQGVSVDSETIRQLRSLGYIH